MKTHVEIMWKSQLTLISNLFHMFFIVFSHFWARDPGLCPKAAAGRALAGPLPPLWDLGPGPGPQNVKRIRKSYEINMEIIRFGTLTSFSCLFHMIFFTFDLLHVRLIRFTCINVQTICVYHSNTCMIHRFWNPIHVLTYLRCITT